MALKLCYAYSLRRALNVLHDRGTYLNSHSSLAAQRALELDSDMLLDQGQFFGFEVACSFEMFCY